MQPTDPSYGERWVVHVDAALEELVPVFFRNRQEDLAALRRALEQGDYATIRMLGHRIKGSSAGYGFDAVAALGARLEEAAGSRDPAATGDLIDDLAQYLDRVEVVYE